jgi:hypothetical protein
MVVDKFGRTDNASSSSNYVVSGGITPSQATNTFLRRDGGNTATADINLDSHRLVNVADPTNNKDAANKEYVDALKVSKTGDIMTGDLTFTTSGPNTIRNVGCQSVTDGQNFNLWLGSHNVRLAYTDFLKYLQL